MVGREFKSILELVQFFSKEQTCIDYLEELRWNGCPVSPFDSNSKIYKCKNNRYRCKNTGKYFNVKTNTLFDNTKLGLQKWFIAIWLITTHKKGITSVQLAKDIGITQKTAWFMLHRIRACFCDENLDNPKKLSGVVEADETFIGGKNKNRHKDKKVKNSQGRSFKDKTPVLGLLQRAKTKVVKRRHRVIPSRIVEEIRIIEDSRIMAFSISDTKRDTIQPLIKMNVEKGIKFFSDEWSAYTGLGSIYQHLIVDHSKKEYVNLKDPFIHTNTIEGGWKILKNSIRDMYNHVSKKHRQKYVDEFVFRYNTKREKAYYC